MIPYIHPGSDHVREYRLRRDPPDLEYDSGGNLRPRQKYLSPPGRSNMLYVVSGINPKLLQDLSIPVVITEGEFKTLALSRLAEHGSPGRPRLLPLGLSGVFNWRVTIGKTVGPDGIRLDVKGVIPDLDWVGWQGRKVMIAYDADAFTKELVRIARSELAAHLRSRGALVGFLEWDLAKGKGIDDHLAIVGPDAAIDEIAHVPGVPGLFPVSRRSFHRVLCDLSFRRSRHEHSLLYSFLAPGGNGGNSGNRMAVEVLACPVSWNRRRTTGNKYP